MYSVLMIVQAVMKDEGVKEEVKQNMRILMKEWSEDVAFTYPKILDGFNSRLGPKELMSDVLEAGAEDFEKIATARIAEKDEGAEKRVRVIEEQKHCQGQKVYIYEELIP